MDVPERVDELIQLVENARAMPMSASCIVNRAEIISLLQQLRGVLPDELSHARMLLTDREAVIAEGRQEADRLIHGARQAQGSMLSESELVLQANREAQRVVEAARQEAAAIRLEAEDYADQKLAHFEVVLNRVLATVGQGRHQIDLLRNPQQPVYPPFGETSENGENAEHGEYAQPVAADEETVAATAVDAGERAESGLAELESIISRTLNTVTQGRDRLTGGREALDELGEHMQAMDTGQHQAVNPADYPEHTQFDPNQSMYFNQR